MGKSPKPVRMSDSLQQAGERRVAILGYKNFSEYVRSLVRYDCLVGGEDHAVTRPITHQSLGEQDRIDAEILEWVEQGKKGRGVLLERMIERAIDKGAKTAQDVKDAISKEITQ